MTDKALAVEGNTTLSEKAWAVISAGDLKGLTPQEKAAYYLDLCASMGLNPRTAPFEYITFQGRHVLYAKKGATDQLRKIHGVSVTNVKLMEDGDYIAYGVSVQDITGRSDYDEGIVAAKNLTGDARANARKKALTQAKRRATLSLCGLSMLDESEIIPDVGYPTMTVDVETGELREHAPVAAIQGGTRNEHPGNNVRVLEPPRGPKITRKTVEAIRARLMAEEVPTQEWGPYFERICGTSDFNRMTEDDGQAILADMDKADEAAEMGEPNVTWDDTTGAPEGFTDAEWTELGGTV